MLLRFNLGIAQQKTAYVLVNRTDISGDHFGINYYQINKQEEALTEAVRSNKDSCINRPQLFYFQFISLARL